MEKLSRILGLVGLLGFSPIAVGKANVAERINILESEANQLSRLSEECASDC